MGLAAWCAYQFGKTSETLKKSNQELSRNDTSMWRWKLLKSVTLFPPADQPLGRTVGKKGA
jgi:hypothetical protein